MILHAIILGIVEGLTEFLPISSSGHLIVAEKALNFRDEARVFTVVIQLGAILAVVWYYRVDILDRIKSLFAKKKSALNFWQNIIIASIPAGLFGLFLDSKFESIAKPWVIATMLILGGLVLWFVESPKKPVKQHTLEIDEMRPRQALQIGLAQSLAIVPGVSRSGASIVGGLLTGLPRVEATAFSFYLGLPLMAVATAYKLYKHSDGIAKVSGGNSALIVGTLVSFVAGLASVSWLLKYISNHSFRLFAVYRIAAGAFILMLVAIGFFG